MKPPIRTSAKYVVNGREYASLDAMPEADRKMFEDANRNGIPDAIEESLAKLGVDPATLTRTGVHTHQVTVTTEQHAEWRSQAGTDEAPPRPGEVRPSGHERALHGSPRAPAHGAILDRPSARRSPAGRATPTLTIHEHTTDPEADGAFTSRWAVQLRLGRVVAWVFAVTLVFVLWRLLRNL